MSEDSESQRSAVLQSGSLLIVAIFLLAILLSVFSWWFRYQATHQAAAYWGNRAVRLIRDAPQVEAVLLANSEQGEPTEIQRKDVSQAPGMTHLRNALIEDRSYEWVKIDSKEQPEESARFALEFTDPEQDNFLRLCFTEDCRWVWARPAEPDNGQQLSCKPISAGLLKVFGEFFPEVQIR